MEESKQTKQIIKELYDDGIRKLSVIDKDGKEIAYYHLTEIYGIFTFVSNYNNNDKDYLYLFEKILRMNFKNNLFLKIWYNLFKK